MAERAGEGSRDDAAANLEGRTIRASNNRRRRMEEGHTWLKVKSAFFYADDGMVAFANPG